MSCNELGLALGQIISRTRIEQGKTQQEVADGIGVKRETVNQWETGTRQLKAEYIIKLSKFLNVSADYLLGLSDTKSRDTDLQAVCNYTGLTEESVTNLKEIWSINTRHEQLCEDLGCEYISDDYDTDRIKILSSILSSNRLAFCLSDLSSAIQVRNNIIDFLSVDLQEYRNQKLNIDSAIDRNLELDKDLKFNLFEAHENFRAMIEDIFSFRSLLPRLNAHLSSLAEIVSEIEDYEQEKIREETLSKLNAVLSEESEERQKEMFDRLFNQEAQHGEHQED